MEAAASAPPDGSPAPAEADWPPELRLPPPPTPADPPPPAGVDDPHFLSSIIGEAAAPPLPPLPLPPPPLPLGQKRKRGRPPKRNDGKGVGPVTASAAGALVPAPPPPPPAAARAARRRADKEEEVVCFICFDGGSLVVCDRRGCPKVYHPACIKRDEAFFQSHTKWNCGWHICSSCEKAVHYMCYTCTYSLCKVCIKQGKFFSVRGTKGFCDTCYGTILLIESKDESATKVDFDDILSWEYLFKLYWVDLKGKLSLTLDELTTAKNRWNVPSTSARKEKEESSDDLYDANDDDDTGFECSSRKRRRANSRKKGKKCPKVNKDCSTAAKKVELPTTNTESVPTEVPNERVPLPVDTKVPNGPVPLPPNMKWASSELLEFIGHMRDGDQSFISSFDVQTLLLDYIKKNNLRDPRKKSQIICDSRLHRLFRKPRVAHFEMLNLLEMHFPNGTSTVSNSSQVTINPNSTHIDTNGYNDMAAKFSPDKRRRIHRKMERDTQVNLEDYAAIDMHNISLIYMRRSLMEDLIDDAKFSDKIHGGFVRIKISDVRQKHDIYRLVKVIGTHKVPEKYSIGKKMTNFALEILNLNKKEIITMDTISNHDFTEEECKRLRQSMKCGVISRLKVGDILEKAKILQSVRVNDWFENEKQKLEHLRDRASETGRRKELREYVEKLQLLDNSEERTRRINEVLEVHVDSHMDPNYESSEETDEKRTVTKLVNRTRPDTTVSPRISSTKQNHPKKVSDSSHRPKSLSTESTIYESGARSLEHGTANRTMYEAGSFSSSGVTVSNDTEPEKVWHYKDPSGNVQGPFTLLQLSKWTSYFPRDLRVWLTFESEERSLLLTEVLSKQQKDFTQPATHTSSKATLVGTGYTRNSPSVDQTNAFSPVGHSVVSSSGTTVQYNKYSVPERESVYSPDDSLSLSTSSIPLKDAYTLNSQALCQNKHSVFIQSPGSSYGHTDLNHDGIQGCSGESNHHHSSEALWSPTVAHMSCSGHGNVESHQNQHISWSQSQHESKNSSQRGPVKDLMNSRRDLSKNLPAQRIGKDASSPLFAWSPAESRTASSQHEGSSLSSTTNPSFVDELHSSIASAKPKSCAPATPIEDRGSSSPSGMLSHAERVPICSPQSAPSASASDICKMEEIMNQQRTLEADTSNASVNQSPESKIFPLSSPDNQDIDREFPSPVPRSENKDIAVVSSRLTPASPENITTNLPGSDTCKMEEVMSQQQVIAAVVSNSSDSHCPQSKVSPVSSPNNEDRKHEYPSSTPRSENKIPAVDSLLSTSAGPENPATTSAHDSDTCKMEELVNQPKTLEVDASNAPLCQSLHSHIFPVPSDNQDIEHECPGPTPNSDSKEPLVNNSATTSVSASDTSKMEEFVNQQKTLEADASNAPLNQSPHSHIFPVPSDNQDIERECPGPTPRSDTKELFVNNSVLTSAAPEIIATTSVASDTCKMEESVNQQKVLEADVSNAPLNHHPHSHISSISSDNQDIQRECPSPTPKSDSKEPLVDNSGLTSAAPEILATTSASDTCKTEEFVNQQKALEADATNASLNQPPHILSVSSNNQDIERECPSPTPRSDRKEPLMDNSVFTSAAPEIVATSSASGTCKMEEFVNQQRPIEADASDASLNQPPCHIFTVSSNDQDIECECPSQTPRSDSKEPFVENLVLTSAVPENLLIGSAVASDACKMEILNKKRTLEADASEALLNQPPHSSVFTSSSGDNKYNACECPGPSPRPEGEQPLMDNSGLTSTVPQNLTSTSASTSDICKMEILTEKRILEANPSNGSITQSPQSKVFLVPSPDILEREFSCETPRPEFKEPVVDSSGLTSAAHENLMTKQHVHSPDAFVPPKFGASTGELGDMKSEFKGEEIIQKEQYFESESIVATRENLLIDPTCGVESIDVSDVLESLMEERGGTSYMPESIEDFLAASAEEESPIPLSPWGEPSYYQGDAVDSALWGIQDSINDMWSLLSPRPMLQPSSGIGTEGKETYDINEVTVTHVNSEFFQRGSMIEENVNQANLSAIADWMLSEQVPSIPNGMSTSPMDESIRVLGSQASTNQNLDWGTTLSTSQNLSMFSNEKAEPSCKSYLDESRKQETTNSSVSISGEAIGNKGLNPPNNANRGSQSQLSHHHRGRYSQISESWLLSSNHSRSRSDRFGSGGSPRSTSKGQTRG